MSIDVVGRLRGKIPLEEVLKYVQERYDKNAYIYGKRHYRPSFIATNDVKAFFGKDGVCTITSASIMFAYKGAGHYIRYYYMDANTWEELDKYGALGLEDMVKSEKTEISSKADNSMKDIIKSIVEHFGGWFQENDYDGIPVFIDSKQST